MVAILRRSFCQDLSFQLILPMPTTDNSSFRYSFPTHFSRRHEPPVRCGSEAASAEGKEAFGTALRKGVPGSLRLGSPYQLGSVYHKVSSLVTCHHPRNAYTLFRHAIRRDWTTSSGKWLHAIARSTYYAQPICLLNKAPWKDAC